MSAIIRLILTAALLWFVYQETGWATTIAVALITASIEAIAIWMRKTQETLARLNRLHDPKRPLA